MTSLMIQWLRLSEIGRGLEVHQSCRHLDKLAGRLQFFRTYAADKIKVLIYELIDTYVDEAHFMCGDQMQQ